MTSTTSGQQPKVTRELRNIQHQHKSAVVWFTGLSGSGKSTLAYSVEEKLHAMGCSTIVLDGDEIRHGLSQDLRFSDADRSENIRRIGEVSKLFVNAGLIVLAAFISPFKKDRERVKQLLAPGDFLEIFVDCPLNVCERRDVKGLYQRARAGKIPHFTGIHSPYEAPENPALTVPTHSQDLTESIEAVLMLLTEKAILPLEKK